MLCWRPRTSTTKVGESTVSSNIHRAVKALDWAPDSEQSTSAGALIFNMLLATGQDLDAALSKTSPYAARPSYWTRNGQFLSPVQAIRAAEAAANRSLAIDPPRDAPEWESWAAMGKPVPGAGQRQAGAAHGGTAASGPDPRRARSTMTLQDDASAVLDTDKSVNGMMQRLGALCKTATPSRRDLAERCALVVRSAYDESDKQLVHSPVRVSSSSASASSSSSPPHDQDVKPVLVITVEGKPPCKSAAAAGCMKSAMHQDGATRAALLAFFQQLVRHVHLADS